MALEFLLAFVPVSIGKIAIKRSPEIANQGIDAVMHALARIAPRRCEREGLIELREILSRS